MSTPPRVRYRSPDEDSARWLGFAFREGDIVTRSKSGTTWMQMICALLVFQTADLPAPLGELSPWLDWRVTPIAETNQRLSSQEHRRFVKTHTPLDGLPLDPRARFFRRGSAGAGRGLLSGEELAEYRSRTEHLAPRALLAWLHRDNPPTVLSPFPPSKGRGPDARMLWSVGSRASVGHVVGDGEHLTSDRL